MHGDERDTIDERIDAALRRYAEAPQFSEPRVALARVRARAEQEPERRWSVWAWAAPSAVVAALIGLVLLWALRVPPTPQIAWIPKAPAVASVDLQQGENATAGPSTPLRRKTPRRSFAQDDRGLVMAQERKLPKQEVFPTPQPLSPQERALVSFVSHAPPALKEQMLAAQKQIDAPIEIADIHIEPLDERSGEPQTKGKDLP